MGSIGGTNPNLRAIVDIGSNGIRFSISSIDPSHARIFPCVFQDRAAISLFDAQYSSSSTPQWDRGEALISHNSTPSYSVSSEKNDIPSSVIDDVCNALIRFKSICRDFMVSDSNVHIVATEATREATNSLEFRNAITTATGWPVTLLNKVEEARTGAYGVASSFYEVQGLFMDLGGGSTQLSWITCKDGIFKMSDTPVSLPYGAAALTRRLTRESSDVIFEEIFDRLKKSIELIGIPDELKLTANDSGGYKIYVSGGGFRGLGHLLLAKHSGAAYPLPIINGYSCSGSDIQQLLQVELMDREIGNEKMVKTFRVSKRRAEQLPAVAILVTAALKAFPPIRKVLFSQGGVREGVIFHDLQPSIRSQDPLYIASKPYAPVLATRYIEILSKGLPSSAPKVIKDRIVPSLANLAFVHSSYPKELQPSASLAVASTGLISGAHALSHEVRSLIGLALCQRWGAELADKTFKDSLISIINPKKLAWWALYCGNLIHVVGGVYPGGNIRDTDTLSFNVTDIENGSFELTLRASKADPQTCAPMVRSRINNLDKRLKKLSKEFGPENSVKVKVETIWI